MQKITREILGEEVTVYWNHRVMRKVDGVGTSYEETFLYVVEVYYDEEGKLIGWTEDKTVYGTDLAELREVLEWMLLSLDKPILIEADLLSEAERARENGESDIFSSEAFEDLPGDGGRITFEEVLESLGLEEDDVQ